MADKEKACILCGRVCPLTFHHLIPKKVHRRNYFRKRYSKTRLNEGVDICRLCHSGLHKFYDEMTLAKQFNSLEQILADEQMQKHIEWVSKQKQA